MIITLLLCAVGLSNTKYEHTLHWKEPPTLIVCEDSGFKRDHIESSVSFWRNQGYDFDMVIYRKNCITHNSHGAIVIAHDKYKLVVSEDIAKTSIDYTEGSINYANIWIERKHIKDSEVIRATIGRSLGIINSSVESDIMNKYDIMIYR